MVAYYDDLLCILLKNQNPPPKPRKKNKNPQAGPFTGVLTPQFLTGPRKIGGPEGSPRDFKATPKVCRMRKRGKKKKKISSPKASNEMFSGSLALLYFHGGRQGSGPDREQSPVNGEIFRTFVRLFVHPSNSPSGPSSQA